MSALYAAVASEQPAGFDTATAVELIDQLGFLHVPGRPTADGLAYLIVALRPQPTLAHFDPERVDYWQTVDGRGVPTSIDRSAGPHTDTPFAWGVISVIDRKAIANYFVSFGGLLTVRRTDDELVAVFSSPAPIVARGGHSQGIDVGATEMAAFVGRLRAAAGGCRELEHQICSLPPLAVYSAFVADSLERHHDRHGQIVGDEEIVEMLRGERHWLIDVACQEWAAGSAVAQSLP